jgi:hypothetical protein
VNDFRHAWNTVIAELTPQPWEYTAPDGVTLTVIPAGLREAPGKAEVLIRVTVGKKLSAETGVTTADMPELLAALEGHTPWQPWSLLGDGLTTVPLGDGGVSLSVTELVYDPVRRDVAAVIVMEPGQRLPLASALRRATDVAKGWED